MTKYRELYERYRDLIRTGTYRPGERLPSLRAAASEEGLGLNTVRTAFDLLERDGLVRPLERGGYYVRVRAQPADLAAYAGPATCKISAGSSTAQKIEYLLAAGGAAAGFALAEPGLDLLPIAKLERLYSSLTGAWIEYGDQSGDVELRSRIVAAYHPCHDGLRSEDVLVTNGATEAIHLAISGLVRRGDSVAVESPTYYDYFRQLSAAGARVVEIPVLPHRGIDLDLLENTLKTRSLRLIIVQPNVQNPTGAIMSDEDKARLVTLAARHGVTILQDDAYGDLAFSRERPKNLSCFGAKADLLYVSSFSKSVAPSLRIGWLHAPRHRAELLKAKSLSSLATNRPAQRVLAAFLGAATMRRHFRDMRSALETRLGEYLDLLSEALPAGSSFVPPSGGCLLWLALPPTTDASAVFAEAAKEGILAAPGELFSANPFFRNHLRINFGHRLTEASRADLLRLCEIAANCAGTLPSGHGSPERRSAGILTR